MGTGITDVIGGPHDFLSPRSDRSDEFQKLCYRSEVMVLFLLKNRDFLGFRMIFKVPLNQIFSNFNTMLYAIKYRLSLIMVYFTFTVQKLLPFFS
jgi:hypothetical protein